MRVSVFGLGYVGVVSAACLARDGHQVVGVDPARTKVDSLNRGNSPVVEEQVDELLAAGVEAGQLSATQSCADALQATDLAFVCVGTPGQTDGSLDLRYLRRVSEEIGRELRERPDFFVVVVRSTMLPGTAREVVIPTLEHYSGKQVGKGFGFCVHPEFLREGSAVRDYYDPPKVVVAASDDVTRDMVSWLAQRPGVPLIETEYEVAELTKYVDNTWHALKVSFANEVGAISKANGIDGRQVMEIFCSDSKLNLSRAYLRPGFAFGGSCLPKDVRALTHRARSLELDLPLINSVLESNGLQLHRGLQMVLDAGQRNVGILGLSFKSGTDDLRESPLVELVKRLLAKGLDVRVYDPNVRLAGLVGANREHIEDQLPEISDLLVPTPDELIAHAETVVVGHRDPEFAKVLDRLVAGQRVIDLASVVDRPRDSTAYDGISW